MTILRNDVRKTAVGELSVVSMENTCVVEIGDSEQLSPLSRALAVQRERAIYRVDEFNLEDYSLFRRPVDHPAATETILIRRNRQQPDIRVGSIRMIALSSASVVQLGSGRNLHAEARVKHIRHLFREGADGKGKGR